MNGVRLASWSMACFVAALASAGCAAYEEPRGIMLFEFPADLDTGVVNFGNYHGVNFHFEVNPRTDFPRGEALRFITPRLEDGAEVYELADVHRVVYSAGTLEVGGNRYVELPARSLRRRRQRQREEQVQAKGNLYVFKRRAGDFHLSFRGQPIVVKADREWIPSILHVALQDTGDGGQAVDRWLEEVVAIGKVSIRTDSRRGFWLVNGQPYEPLAEDVLIFEGAAPFANR